MTNEERRQLDEQATAVWDIAGRLTRDLGSMTKAH